VNESPETPGLTKGDSNLVVEAVEEEGSENEASITEEEAWELLQVEYDVPDVKIIRLVKKDHWLTVVQVDLLNGEIMESEAVVDSGSVISFLSVQGLKQCAPGILEKVKRYPDKIIGVSGEAVEVVGTLELPCKVAGKNVVHEFVVGTIMEPVLLGYDFMSKHRARWDWTLGALVYQNEGEEEDDVTSRYSRLTCKVPGPMCIPVA
jgi:hypothetical protein